MTVYTVPICWVPCVSALRIILPMENDRLASSREALESSACWRCRRLGVPIADVFGLFLFTKFSLAVTCVFHPVSFIYARTHLPLCILYNVFLAYRDSNVLVWDMVRYCVCSFGVRLIRFVVRVLPIYRQNALFVLVSRCAWLPLYWNPSESRDQLCRPSKRSLLAVKYHQTGISFSYRLPVHREKLTLLWMDQ